MVNVDKIKKLAERQGIKLTRICELSDRKVYYLNDVKRNGGNMPQEYIEKIAALLSTTPEYLCDETDDPEIPPEEGKRRIRRIPVFGNVAAIRLTVENGTVARIAATLRPSTNLTDTAVSGDEATPSPVLDENARKAND